MISVDPRKEKIRTLKETIQTSRSKVVEVLTNVNVEEELKLTPEEQAVKKQDRKDTLAILKAEISAATEDLKLTRMNKNSSSAFEWHPHKGMNRQQARNFRRARRKNRV